jgi:hypothetical protein
VPKRFEEASVQELPEKKERELEIRRPGVKAIMNESVTEGRLQKNTAHLSSTENKNIVMMAKVKEQQQNLNDILISTEGSTLSAIEDSKHMWLLNSASSSHICGNRDLFDEIYQIPKIKIETSSGESFTANQKGTVQIKIQSCAYMHLPDLILTLENVIFVLKLNANLLSVG